MSNGSPPSQTKSQFLPTHPSVAILGVSFDPVTMEETVALIEGMIQARTPRYLATANLDFTVQATWDVELRRILFDAHLVLCDGMPLVWASRLLHAPLPERVTGSDMTPLLLKIASEKGYRVFMLGGAEDSLMRAMSKIKDQYPNLEIDAYSPPFTPLLEMDQEDICGRIESFKPDLLFVAFGCPKQEKWINMNFRKGLAPVSVGVGATIDFIAGQVNRAPLWMRKTGLEWVFRLCQEPKRLFKRYMIGLWMFSSNLLKQIYLNRPPRRLKKYSSDPVHFESIHSENELSYQLCKLPGVLTARQISRQIDHWQKILLWNGDIILDLTQTQFLDSLAVGLVLRLRKQTRSQEKHLILVGAEEAVRSIFTRYGMEIFLQFESTLEEGLKKLELDMDVSPVIPESGTELMKWVGEVTAANCDSVWESTRSNIESHLGGKRTGPLQVDLSKLIFIDSSGVGTMVKVKKFAREKGIGIQFLNPSPAVENVLQLTQMKKFLLDH